MKCPFARDDTFLRDDLTCAGIQYDKNNYRSCLMLHVLEQAEYENNLSFKDQILFFKVME